jgi:hypothetical protein
MNAKVVAISFVVLVTVLGVPVSADWNVGDPVKMHFPQLPDVAPTGMDVKDAFPKILADDFLCTETGPIRDVHIWGSWLYDQLPLDASGAQLNPTAPLFKLSIHADIPRDPAGGPSRPGAELWSTVFNPNTYKARLWGTGDEFFYDPNVGQVIGTDTQIWQYNFLIPSALAFVQQKGTIYWLDVQAFLPNPTPGINQVFGWKTSLNHFNDDAVWGDTTTPLGTTTGWQNLAYPTGHPFAGQSIDLAFVITPEPGSVALLSLGVLALMRRRR